MLNVMIMFLDFHGWVRNYDGARFWCKGLNFDWPFLESYFKECNLVMPFDFRQAKDTRSFIAGLQRSGHYDEPDVDHVGSKHDAVNDCLTQILALKKAKNDTL